MAQVIGRDWERAFIEITNRCNFDCLFCPSGISERPRQDMDARLAMSIVDQLAELGFAGTTYFHVLGEPLLHPGVFDIISHRAEVGARPVVFTNGAALTEKNVLGLISSGAAEVVISMQTITEQAYDTLRKAPLSWDEYLARIREALVTFSNARDAESTCSFRVSMGLKKPDPQHPDDLHFLEYDSKEQVKSCIADIFAGVGGIDLSHAYSLIDADGVGDMGPLRVGEAIHLSVKPMGNWRRMWRDSPVTSGRCPIFGKEIAVLSNGDVTFCHLDYDGRASFGNVQDTSLASLIGSDKFVKIAEAFSTGTPPPGCEYCKAVIPLQSA